MDDTIYLIPLIEAIALNYSAMTVVSKIYEQNKTEIYAIAHTHRYYNHPLFDSAGIDFAIACRRALGVYLFLNGDILPVIKRGWPAITKYINGGHFDDQYFRERYVANRKLTNNTSMANTAAAIYLLTMAGRGDESELMRRGTAEYAEHQERKFATENGNYYSELLPADEANARFILALVEKKLGIKLESIQWVTEITSPEVKLLGWKATNFLGSMLWEIEAEGVSIGNLGTAFSRSDILQTIAVHAYRTRKIAEANHGEGISELGTDDIFMYVISVIFARVLGRALRDSQRAYFRDSSETLFAHIAELDAQISELYSKVAEAQRQTLTELLQKGEAQQQLAAHTLKTEALERENQALKAKNAENRDELIALRNLAFSLQEDEEEDYQNEPVIIPNNLRVLICGGRENWQRRLREELPDNFSFLTGSRNFDVGVLRNQDWLLIYAPAISHTFYERVMNNRPEGVRIGYLSKQNVESTLREISRVLEGK